jgi:hypothetical protein
MSQPLRCSYKRSSFGGRLSAAGHPPYVDAVFKK